MEAHQVYVTTGASGPARDLTIAVLEFLNECKPELEGIVFKVLRVPSSSQAKLKAQLAAAGITQLPAVKLPDGYVMQGLKKIRSAYEGERADRAEDRGPPANHETAYHDIAMSQLREKDMADEDDESGPIDFSKAMAKAMKAREQSGLFASRQPGAKRPKGAPTNPPARAAPMRPRTSAAARSNDEDLAANFWENQQETPM